MTEFIIKEIIKAVVYICIGSGLGIMLLGIVSINRRVEQENEAYQEGRKDGYQLGYQAGDRDGYKAGLRISTARVDVAPGVDSDRPEHKKEFPREAYANDKDMRLGILSPSKVFCIKFGKYGQDVLDQYLDAEVERRSDHIDTAPDVDSDREVGQQNGKN